MSTRIPSSLKWLIDKRARLDGEIKKAQASIEAAQRLIVEISIIQKDLAAIDRALGMHEIEVDPECIKSVVSRTNELIVPYGQLTHTLLLCLRLSNGESQSTDAITLFVAEQFSNLHIITSSQSQLRNSVYYRLKNLAADKVIIRHPPIRGIKGQRWALPVTNSHS